jgi:ubiquilin
MEAAVTDTPENPTLHVQIRTNSQNFDIPILSTMTIIELKKFLLQLGIDPTNSATTDSLRLVFRGKVLESENNTVDFYGIKSGSIVYASIKSGAVPGNTGISGIEVSAMNQKPESGMESLMAQMMENPAFQQMFENSDMMERILQNPQIQQLAENNPELRAVLNDPGTIRQMTRMMQNPNLRREMMRSTDRAMANIENLPGGFDALRRMYNTIQEPMLDAISQPFSNEHNSSSNTTSSTQSQVDPERPTTSPLPNPWNRSSTPVNPFQFPNIPFTSGMNPGMNPLNANLMNNPNLNQLMSQVMSDPQLMQYMVSGDLQSAQQYMLTNPQLLQSLMTPELMQSAFNLMNTQNNPSTLNPNSLPFNPLSNLNPNSNPMFPGMDPNFTGMMFPGLNNNTTMPFPDWGNLSNNLGMNMFPTFPPFGMNPTNTNTNANFPQFGINQTNTNTNNNNLNNNINNNSNNNSNSNSGNAAERYAVQQQQLRDMGFTDTQKNFEALQSTNGNVDLAVERILMGNQ